MWYSFLGIAIGVMLMRFSIIVGGIALRLGNNCMGVLEMA